MGKLIRLEDAYICCRGTSQQIVKDTLANFSVLASSFLEEHQRKVEAGALPTAIVKVAAGVIKSVFDRKNAETELINSMILGVGATTALTQQFEWKARDVELDGVEVNADGGLTIGQAITLMNIASEEAQARARQRQRNCFFERSLRQDNPARVVYGRLRSRKARPSLGGRFLKTIRNLIGR